MACDTWMHSVQSYRLVAETVRDTFEIGVLFVFGLLSFNATIPALKPERFLVHVVLIMSSQ